MRETRAALYEKVSREMQARVDSLDWSRTPVGPVESWPGSLRTTVKTLLASRYPMVLAWGPDLIQFYNDAYAELIGDKHPAALGIDIRITLAEAWDTLGPMIREVMSTGVANWTPALLLVLERSGYREESYFSVSHAPVEDDGGRIAGMLAVCSEVTQQVLGDRRLRLLRDLATSAGQTRDVGTACRDLAAAIAGHPLDVPFAQLFLREPDGEGLAPRASVGLAAGDVEWPLERAAAGETVLIEDAGRRAAVAGGPWGEPVRTALAMPVASSDQAAPLGVLVVGVSPNRALDEGYRSFFELLAAQVSVALRNAQAYEEERRRAEMLAELDRAKTAFFSNVSHELRTPLTLMLGPLEEALQDGGQSPEQRCRLEIAYRNSRRLLKLVNTLLDFSRIEAGRADARYEPTDLAAFTADLASVFRSAVETAGLEMIVDCPPLPEPVYVDRDMWEKIVLNLLSNAFKFTERGRITVRLRAMEESVELAVADTGCGIPEGEVGNVFERFHRIEGTRGRTYEGTGIGLALVQELARLHGGSVRVESSRGSGSTFTVAIPLGSRHLPADRLGAGSAPVLPPEAFVEEALRWLPEEAAAPEPVPGRRPHVLVADDNADMREYLRNLLRARYEVTAVPDGEAAWSAVMARLPDLVLSDVMMPRLDGFGLLDRLRSDPRTRSVPVVLLSARAGEASKVEGLEAGADAYLVKPFGARELLARLAATLELARLREETARVRSEAALARERAALLESITDAFYALDHEWRFTYINQQCESYYGIRREDLLGQVVWDAFPMAAGTEIEEAFRRAAREQTAVHRELLSPFSGRWIELHAYPSSLGLSVNFRDVTERKQAAELRERLLERERAARGEAERVSRLKDEFLSTLSHELRTPLNAILGWAQLLGERSLGPEQIAQGVAVIERSARAQTKLIEDLLDLGRIVSGKIRLEVRPLDLAPVVAAALETMQPTADAKGVRLESDLTASAGTVTGDPARLHQVVTNLLSNALKFTPRGGRVLVRLERAGTHVLVSVADTGQGIEPDFLPHIFERFQQADGSTTRLHGGLGIGLSIVKSLVELHGGFIQAESEGKDRGATLTVALPVISPAGPGSASPRRPRTSYNPQDR